MEAEKKIGIIDMKKLCTVKFVRNKNMERGSSKN